jgi:hypothetical protein
VLRLGARQTNRTGRRSPWWSFLAPSAPKRARKPRVRYETPRVHHAARRRGRRVAARCARAEANADDRVFAQLVAGGFGTASGGSRKLRPSRSTDQAIHVEFPSRGITAHLVERRPPVATLGAADAVILVNLDASGVPMEISTSYAERGNLSIRMACRRFARLADRQGLPEKIGNAIGLGGRATSWA